MNKRWNRNQRKRWWLFLKGATAASKVFGTHNLYRCPLCFCDFELADALSGEKLTLEHVPPKSAGGSPYVLTCDECNHRAGHIVDCQIKRRNELNLFYDVIGGKEVDKPVRAKIESDGIQLNTEILRRAATGFEIKILGDHNSPKEAKQMEINTKQSVEAGTFTGSEIHITSQASYDKRLADLSDLRAAYLGAFATFGYTLITRKTYTLIRDQLMQPEVEQFQGWIVKSKELNRNGFMIIEDVPCLIFCYKQISVLLPHFEEEENLYERLVAKWSRGQQIKLKGGFVSWPERMRLALDLET